MKEQSRGWGVNLSGWCQRPQQQTELALYVCICKHACAFFPQSPMVFTQLRLFLPTSLRQICFLAYQMR